MQPLPQNLSKYVLVFGNCLLIASKKDFTQNFLFCFESVLYTRLETWGSNEYIRNFEDFIKRENLETRYDKDFLQELSVEEVQNVQLGKLAIRFGVPYVLLHLVLNFLQGLEFFS